MAHRKMFGPIPLPKTSYDTFAFTVFILGGQFMVWYEHFHILPYYHPSNDAAIIWFHYAFTLLCYIQIYGNLWQILTAKISGENISPAELPEGWRYCDRCMANFPPRSHHCKLCDICVLKRDHHCWFAGRCVGYANHRYYLVMITYCWIVAIYANIFNWEFVSKQLGGFSFGTWFCILMPHVCFTFGYLTVYQLFISAITSVGSVLLLMFSYLLYAQIMQIFQGQTQFERKMDIRKYNLGVSDNFLEITGSKGFLVWLSPWCSSELPGDGISFREVKAK